MFCSQAGSFAWRRASLPADAGSDATLALSVLETSMQHQLRWYQDLVNQSQGEPMLRWLGSVAELAAPDALAAALDRQGAELYQLVALHILSEAHAQSGRVDATKLVEGVASPWDAADVKRWKVCVRELGPNMWEGKDELAGLLDGAASVAADGCAMIVLAVTRERQPRLGTLHGGVGRDEERRTSKRSVSCLEVPPFTPNEQWLMPHPAVVRLAEVVADFPEVARPAIIESLPTVMANPCTNLGTAKCVLADVALWDVPYDEIFTAHRDGFDCGKQKLTGDQLTLARFNSVLTLFASSAMTLRAQLVSLDETDPRFFDVLSLLVEAVDNYKRCRAYVEALGQLHFEFHQAEVIVTKFIGVLLGTLRTLLKLTGLDAAATDFAKWQDFFITTERALWSALFDTMRAEGEYPTLNQFPLRACTVNGLRTVDAPLVLNAVGSFIELKIASGDAVSLMSASLLRHLHLQSAFHTAIRIDDERYVLSCGYRVWLPLYRSLGKHQYAGLCAKEISRSLTSSERLRRAFRQLHTHAQVGTHKAPSELKRSDVRTREIRTLSSHPWVPWAVHLGLNQFETSCSERRHCLLSGTAPQGHVRLPERAARRRAEAISRRVLGDAQGDGRPQLALTWCLRAPGCAGA
jgi:hypothetical protein